MKNSIKVLVAMRSIAIIVMAAVITVGAFAQQYEDGGNFQVERVGNGIKITGYVGTNTVVNIPPTIQGLPVTIIGEYAFEGNNSIRSVTIPDSVTEIQQSAFNSVIGLTSVTFGSGLTDIGESAFERCIVLRSITIPRSVRYIRNRAFQNCLSLTSVTIQAQWNSQAGFATNAFLGDLRAKFFATPTGTPGTYTTPGGPPDVTNRAVWTKQ